LSGAISPILQGVLSTEYQTGDKDQLALLEVVYLHLVDAPPLPLLIYDRNTLAIGADLRWPLWRPLGFEIRGLVGINPKTATVQPELNLKFEHWVVSGGSLWLDGEPFSLAGTFTATSKATPRSNGSSRRGARSDERASTFSEAGHERLGRPAVSEVAR